MTWEGNYYHVQERISPRNTIAEKSFKLETTLRVVDYTYEILQNNELPTSDKINLWLA